MGIRLGKVFGAGFMLAASVASFAAFSQAPPADNAGAQAAEREALEPGVDTSGPIADSDSPAGNEAPVNDPAEPTAVLAQAAGRRSTGRVMDSIQLSATQVTGNQELPKVLYIVPWQKAEPGDLVGKPVNTLLDEVLAPIDREEFVRSVNYYGDIHGGEEQ